jgi:hypothetical protein
VILGRSDIGEGQDPRLLLARHNKLDEVPEDDQPDLYIEAGRGVER